MNCTSTVNQVPPCAGAAVAAGAGVGVGVWVAVGVLPLISIGVSCLLDSAKDEIMDVAAVRKNVMSRKAAEDLPLNQKFYLFY